MDTYTHILRSVPLFRHCTDDELASLRGIGRVSSIKKGQSFDLKKISSFNVVIGGAFEIEALGRTDIVYLAPGSFFGNVPFTENRLRGTIRAMVDSTLMLFPMDELYRFFFLSYRCLRGYLKITGRMGFDVNDVARKYLGRSMSVVTSFSMERDAGKTLLACSMGLALSREDRTIILDLSYGGGSVFDVFEKKILPPMSQVTEGGPSARDLVGERIEHAAEGLDILNVAHGSKVRVRGDILQPLLFILSQEYRYVVLDLSNDDEELRDGCFALSDSVFCVLKNPRGKSGFYPVADSVMKNGQRVYYVLNEHCARSVKNFSGGFILERFTRDAEEGNSSFTGKAAASPGLKQLVSMISRKRRAAVFASHYLDAAFYGGFLLAMNSRGIEFDMYYSSSLGYAVLALYHLAGRPDEFRSRFLEFFSEERFAGFLDITFPSDYLFRKHGITRFAEEVGGGVRLEELHALAAGSVTEIGTGRRIMISTGPVSEMIAASFVLHPLFEGVPVAGLPCHSGFPGDSVRVESLFRTDVSEAVYISVDNSEALQFGRGKVIPFFLDYIAGGLGAGGIDKTSVVSDRNYVLGVSEGEMKGEKILRLSEDMANKLLK